MKLTKKGQDKMENKERIFDERKIRSFTRNQ